MVTKVKFAQIATLIPMANIGTTMTEAQDDVIM